MVGLVVGIPVGLLVGRWVWDRIALGAGLGSTVAAPVVVIVALALVSLAIVNLVALVPARACCAAAPCCRPAERVT